MGTLERLDDPINTPMRVMMIGMREHTRKGVHPRMRHADPRDMKFHTSDPWSPYKIKGAKKMKAKSILGKRFGEQV
jgi:hypothetical protein